ncbi:MAG: ROK family protein [Caldilineaceae bacterium]|nr:ROK family protein [Caldilineaceae bacterium]
MAELVDRAGNVTSAHTIDWRDLPVQSLLSELLPTVVESDVRAPALAEARYGAGREYPLFVYITVGTGISSCLVIDGEPFAGARGNALVLATMPLTTTCSECGARLSPVLEEFASGPALARRFEKRLRQRHGAVHEMVERGETVLEATQRGDLTRWPWLRRLAKRWASAWRGWSMYSTPTPSSSAVGLVWPAGCTGNVLWRERASTSMPTQRTICPSCRHNWGWMPGSSARQPMRCAG